MSLPKNKNKKKSSAKIAILTSATLFIGVSLCGGYNGS